MLKEAGAGALVEGRRSSRDGPKFAKVRQDLSGCESFADAILGEDAP
jgi:hypothetical protein